VDHVSGVIYTPEVPSQLSGFAALVALAACGTTAQPPFTFNKRVVDPEFRSEGVTVFDVDHDGHLDIVTEELWYAGPTFKPHEIRTPRSWDPLTAYAHCFGAFHMDVDGDGYDDLLAFGPPGEDALWCRNPSPEDRHWDCAQITPQASGESPLMTAMFTPTGSMLMGVEPDRVLGWMTPAEPLDAPWLMHALSPPNFPMAARFEHGLGLGDVNGDGRPDVITGSGWLEQPINPGDSPWPWHPAAFCPNNCAHMFTFDFNGDGIADLIGTSPHNFGAWWWEQQPGEGGGEPIFIQHEIDTTNSQNHAARLVDLDGDGSPELITGKRWWAHFDEDPGARDPALLLVYHPTRVGTDVRWERIVVDDDSGIGSQFEVVDIDGNGKPDIVVSNKKGLNLFKQ
jgi:hypothetical protein